MFVYQKGQLKLMLPFLILPVASTLITYYLHYKVEKIIRTTLINQIPVAPEITESMRSLQMVATFGAVGIILLSVFASILFMLYSHRLFGPIVAIERHVNNLCQGIYTSKITLRNYDEWKEIARGLNQITGVLQETKTKTS
jgi:signal transduction histidine kinase